MLFSLEKIMQKMVVFCIDDSRSCNCLDLNENGFEIKKVYGYILVALDFCSIFGWTTPSENVNAQTTRDFWGKIIETSKRKPKCSETDERNDSVNSFSADFIEVKEIKGKTSLSSKSAVFSKVFIKVLEISIQNLFLKNAMLIESAKQLQLQGNTISKKNSFLLK